MDLKQLFGTTKPVIGVVHLLPLPTSPRWAGNLNEVIARAEQEATALAAGGVHGIIFENFFDAPFTKGRVDAAVVSAMSLVVKHIIPMVHVPVGVNVLRNDGYSALAIAACTGASFVRVNVLTGVMATDQGIIEGEAHHLLRYRRELGKDIKILADVLVKHAQPLSVSNLQLAIADTIERGLADGIIFSGQATGHAPSPEHLAEAIAACNRVPLFIGSGASWENIAQLIPHADGVIVASSLKRHGQIEQPIDPLRVSRFVEMVNLSLDLSRAEASHSLGKLAGEVKSNFVPL
ncbi:MAG: BtpA/SgcQ family protein [Pseudanabaenaceae cyanobacterium bins.68]|nr:BtpA/SgcQ family protein [Pseudanabaenaceae cyanobacterium bins.68]